MENSDSFEVQRLKQILEINLDSPVSQMIGVFGINSDHFVYDALHQVGRNFILLNQTHSHPIANIYEILGANLMNFFEHSGAVSQMEPYVKNTLTRCIASMAARHNYSSYSSEYSYGLEGLSLLNEEQQLDTKCREMLRTAKEALHMGSDEKFIFHLEVDFSHFTCVLLRDLERIQSPDLVIIISSLAPRDIIANFVSTETGGLERGELILQKYFPVVNSVSAD